MNMTNEELAAELAAIAGRIGDLAVRLSAPREAKAPEAEPAKEIKLEDVRAALTDLTTAKGAATTKQLLAEYSVTKLSQIVPDKYATLLADAKAWASE